MQFKTQLSLLSMQSKGGARHLESEQMSHSPLHQRLHLRLAMRQNFSPPTLSPLPPYPVTSPLKVPGEAPATAPPSPEPVPLEPSAATSAELLEETAEMRATHIRPRTAPASPERPGTAYSTRSTIRQVEPSPEGLHDALTKSFAEGGTAASGPFFEPFPPFNPSRSDEALADDTAYTHIPSTEPAAGLDEAPGALRRGGTPSGRSSPRKSRSCSSQKSRSQSPRKHMVRTPTLPAHQESPPSAYSVAESEQWEAPDTPSPVSREQQRQVYAPLKVHRPFAKPKNDGESAGGQNTHARMANYMRKMQTQQRGGKAKAVRAKREGAPKTDTVKSAVAPIPHIVQAMAQPPVPSQTMSPFSAAQRQAQQQKEPARHASVSKRSEHSGASVASKHSIFSTPGRDEMERKKPIVEEDEGPFAEATSMQDLAQKRRRVSEGTSAGQEQDRKRLCGMKCVVM